MVSRATRPAGDPAGGVRRARRLRLRLLALPPRRPTGGAGVRRGRRHRRRGVAVGADRANRPGELAADRAAAVFVTSTAIALAAIGVPTSTLVPGGWDQLGAGIDRGLEGLGGDVDFPYVGAEQWSSLILLAGLVCLLALAAALTFWPRRAAGSGARIGGLATLIAVYAAAAAMRSGPEPLLAGLALVLLVAAWLWLPGLSGRGALITTIVVAGLGLLALPIAAALEARPWVDYRDWKLAAPSDARSFAGITPMRRSDRVTERR